MGLSKEGLLSGLIEKNYFPNQRRINEDMPPIFSTAGLNKYISKDIFLSKRRSSVNYPGYDFVEYKATKFNNVPRYFGIPHPKPYIDLCFTISSSWKLLQNNIASDNSRISPSSHSDGRIIVMDYESGSSKTLRKINATFNNQFYIKTDISSCFPSLYSHALPWALVGIERAKKKKGHKWRNKWFNRIDESTRWTKRNETQGVLIGPATSNILAEVVLAEVDRKLSDQYDFERYIDDYKCYVSTYEQAEEFVRRLSQELRIFNFHLNPSKTFISTMPITVNESWRNELLSSIPHSKSPYFSELTGFLDNAVNIQLQHHEGSVIKYAAKVAIQKASGKRRLGVAKYLLGLSFHYPVLIPVLNNLLEGIKDEYQETYGNELEALLKDRVLNQCSDGICWCLFYLYRAGCEIDSDIAEAIIKTADCLSVAMLAKIENHKEKAIRFSKSLKRNDLYLLDRYWLLLYELFLTDDITEPYGNDASFEIMKDAGVSFLRDWPYEP